MSIRVRYCHSLATYRWETDTFRDAGDVEPAWSGLVGPVSRLQIEFPTVLGAPFVFDFVTCGPVPGSEPGPRDMNRAHNLRANAHLSHPFLAWRPSTLSGYSISFTHFVIVNSMSDASEEIPSWTILHHGSVSVFVVQAFVCKLAISHVRVYYVVPFLLLVPCAIRFNVPISKVALFSLIQNLPVSFAHCEGETRELSF